jgi:hypothetical protein
LTTKDTNERVDAGRARMTFGSVHGNPHRGQSKLANDGQTPGPNGVDRAPVSDEISLFAAEQGI